MCVCTINILNKKSMSSDIDFFMVYCILNMGVLGIYEENN